MDRSFAAAAASDLGRGSILKWGGYTAGLPVTPAAKVGSGPFLSFYGGARFASFAFLLSVVPAFVSGGGFAFGGGDALTVAALLHRS